MPEVVGSYRVDNRLLEQATALGFDAVGVSVPTLPTHIQSDLQTFVARGYHGDMSWMEANIDRRIDPYTLWPDVRSILMLGHNYAPEINPLEKLHQKNRGNISCYAVNKDYHDVIKKKLKTLAGWVAKELSCEVKVFVDTAPIMEKPLAALAGIGWQGKHSCLVSREFGSWLFLGSIFTNARPEFLSEDAGNMNAHAADLCGTCRACLDICPTQAFTAERQLDARKCISYLTIEHKGQIPLEYRKAMGNRIYGCDDCLAVCPWNKFAKQSSEIAYHPREALRSPLLADLVRVDDAAFRVLFAQSPVKRIGRDRFVRNVLVAIGNSEDSSLIPVIAPLREDPSPLVSEMAHWAIDALSINDRA